MRDTTPFVVSGNLIYYNTSAVPAFGATLIFLHYTTTAVTPSVPTEYFYYSTVAWTPSVHAAKVFNYITTELIPSAKPIKFKVSFLYY